MPFKWPHIQFVILLSHCFLSRETILPLKSKLSGKFKRFNDGSIDGSIEMKKNS